MTLQPRATLASDAERERAVEALREARSEGRLTLEEFTDRVTEAAALELEQTVGRSPRLASPGYLDDIGVATMRLERALGEQGASPFAEAMKHAAATVDELSRDVERNYKLELAP